MDESSESRKPSAMDLCVHYCEFWVRNPDCLYPEISASGSEVRYSVLALPR